MAKTDKEDMTVENTAATEEVKEVKAEETKAKKAAPKKESAEKPATKAAKAEKPAEEKTAKPAAAKTTKAAATKPATRAKVKAKPNTVFTWGTGRRKNAIARVRICEGDGKFLINNREVEEYLPRFYWSSQAVEALEVAGVKGKIDVFVNAHGGGLTGQAGAIRLGLARAIQKLYPNTRPALKKAGFLTRDPRMVERMKVGMKGARAAKQFSKR